MKNLQKQLGEVIFRVMSDIENNFSDYIDSFYAEAQKIWQAVSWPKELFTKYLAGRKRNHPTDMYLAGAAAHRIDSAWTTIDSDLKGEVQRNLKNKPRADYSIDELWAETYFKLLREDTKHPILPSGKHPAAIIKYRGDSKLTGFMTAVGLKIAIDRKRKRKEQAMPTDSEGNTITPASKQPPPEQISEDQEQADIFYKFITDGLDQLESKHRFILIAIYKYKIKQTRLAEALKTQNHTITRMKQKAIEQLRQHVESLPNFQWNEKTIEAWQAAWDKFCDSPESGENQATDTDLPPHWPDLGDLTDESDEENPENDKNIDPEAQK